MLKSQEYRKSIETIEIVTAERAAQLLEQNPNCHSVNDLIGQKLLTIPLPKNYDELWEQFTKYYSQRICESLERWFLRRYGVDNLRAVQDELDHIYQFIATANEISLKDSFDLSILSSRDREEHEYSRLMNGFYKNKALHNFDPLVHFFFNDMSLEVYGKYVLFKEWLERKIPRKETAKLEKEETYEPGKTISEINQSLGKYIEVLRCVEPPIIGRKNEYLLGPRSKGSFTAFIAALKQKGKLASHYSDAQISTSLNSLIDGLELGKDGKTLRNPRTTAYRKYYNSIYDLIE